MEQEPLCCPMDTNIYRYIVLSGITINFLILICTIIRITKTFDGSIHLHCSFCMVSQSIFLFLYAPLLDLSKNVKIYQLFFFHFYIISSCNCVKIPFPYLITLITLEFDKTSLHIETYTNNKMAENFSSHYIIRPPPPQQISPVYNSPLYNLR